MLRYLALLALALIAASLTPAVAVSAQEIKTGKAAFGDWRQDAPGVRRHIRLEDLPRADVNRSASNPPQKIARKPNARPKVPKGFEVTAFATGIANPRAIRFAPNGDLFVADSEANQVRIYRPGKDGKAAASGIYAAKLHMPYGIAFYPLADPQWVYIANSNSVVRVPYKTGDLKAKGKPEVIISHIPETHHWTRDIAFSPDGKVLYLEVGSGSNVGEGMSPAPEGGSVEEWSKTHPLGAAWGTEARRANVLTFDPDGKNERIFATGLRNCSGLTIQPGSGNLWCVVNERDELGDDVPFEFATHVLEGKFYGWPWYYNGNHEDPHHKGKRPDLADKVTVPEVFIQAHSAPLGIAFYEGKSFPAEYKGDAFVTLHGSWNRAKRTGYKVVRLLFKDGEPTGIYEDFATGFVASDAGVWGRPVGVAVAPDGALFVSDDGSGSIWRIAYRR